MNRVTKRAGIMLFFVLILVCGTGFFVGEYFVKSSEWVLKPSSPHVYNNQDNSVQGNRIPYGVYQDQSGQLLLAVSETEVQRTYSDSEIIRRSTLHWLGDQRGYIAPRVISHYAKKITGFDTANGLYSYGGTKAVTAFTLSARVQSVALEALAGRRGTVAVYNYKTGEILCAVTSPTFDPLSPPVIDPDDPGEMEGVYLNRFIQSAYIPGSIFKVVTTAAALDCIDDIQMQTFTCTGQLDLYGGKVTCEVPHGTLDLRTALARSCNCAFAQISQQIGPQRMSAYVEKFRAVGSVTFDGITTASGNYNVTDATAADFAWSCIGQHTDQINPCAFLTFIGAIANGGQGAVPHVIDRISVDENVMYQAQPEYTEQIVSAQIAQTLRRYLRNNVYSIYGDWNFPGLSVCGKSGTSQLGGEMTSNAMFAGFVEDEAYPLAFIAVVENGGYGSSTCVPILSKVLAECKAVMDESG